MFQAIVARTDDSLAVAVLEFLRKGHNNGRTPYQFPEWGKASFGECAEGQIAGRTVRLVKFKGELNEVGLPFEKMVAVVSGEPRKPGRYYSLGRKNVERKALSFPAWTKQAGEIAVIYREKGVEKLARDLAALVFKKDIFGPKGYPPSTFNFGASCWSLNQLQELMNSLETQEGSLTNYLISPNLRFEDSSQKLIELLRAEVRPLFWTRRQPDELIADAVWRVLRSPEICKSRNSHLTLNIEKEYKSQIQYWIEQDRPIEIVFIGFPFKITNPLRTNRKYPDMGELAYLRRLIKIHRTIQQVYSPGIKWIILTEGEHYSKLFSIVNKEWVEAYQKTIAEWITYLPEGERIKLDSLARLVKLHPEVEELTRSIEVGLWRQYQHWGEVPGDELFNHVHKLFFWVLIPQELELSPFEQLLLYYGNDNELSSELRELKKEKIEEGARETCRYIAFNLAKNRVGQRGIIQDTFPNALYVSITSKRGRFAFYPLQRGVLYFPHHGVPLQMKTGRIEIKYLFEIITHPHNYVGVRVEGDKEEIPFYYKEV